MDFDSTFITVEALDELAGIAVADGHGQKQQIQAIEQLTAAAMSGQLSFREALIKRLQILQAHRRHLVELVARLQKKISPSILRNRDFLLKESASVYIISGGFKEIILPVATEFGLRPENVYANEFIFDDAGYIVGCDLENILSGDDGKVQQLKLLNLPGDIYVIGDGITDYQMRVAGCANKFFAFTENIMRDAVVEQADHVAPTFDEFLYINNLPMTISYPKNRIKVLLLEGIDSRASDLFSTEGYTIEVRKESLKGSDLQKAISEVSILGIRSQTSLDPEVFNAARKLIAVGAFCIGTNQINLPAATAKGVAVFNAPYSNTRSVVELVLGEMLMLQRQVVDRSHQLHQGIWNKSAKGSYELRGKRLGIIGYGNIGSQLSVLAEALGLEVYYYDLVEKLTLGNAKNCRSLGELLSAVDIVSVHVDGRSANKNLIGACEFFLMKNGVIFINASRGSVVDLAALAESLASGKVRGAAVDVFPAEPAGASVDFKCVLQGLPNVILTPHLGGSTEEAQVNIADFVARRIIDYVNTGNTYGSVNFPNVQLPALENAHRLLHIHRNVPGILAQINGLLAARRINIMGQYLKTNEEIGYVITDINKEYASEIIAELKEIPETIKFRVLY